MFFSEEDYQNDKNGKHQQTEQGNEISIYLSLIRVAEVVELSEDIGSDMISI